MLADFHFLRPWWLLGLLILLIVPMIKSSLIKKDSPWHKIADYSLLKSLLMDSFSRKKKTFLRPILFLCWLITIIALSGPCWEKVEITGISTKANIVIVAEVSPYMQTNDIKPTRIERMKYKLYDLLEKTKDNNVAMIIYDNYPYILSPFTNDINIIKNFVSVFDVAMMPSPGTNVEKAMAKAQDMIGTDKNGHIIMFVGSDGYNPADLISVAGEIKSSGNTLSIIAVGDKNPSPVLNSQGGLVQNSDGKTLTSSIDFDLLETAALAGGGIFTQITADDSDIDSALNIITNNEKKASNIKITQWQDMGIFFVFPLLPFALFLFKRGFVITIMIFVSFPAYAFDWDSLWKNNNQQGLDLFAKNPSMAAEKFTDKSYKGAAQYKSKQYDKALQNFIDSNEMYNAGNALAHLGKIDEAIKTYEKFLEQNPNHEDAKYNLEYLKKQKEQQKNQDQQNQNQQGQGQQNQQQNQQGQEQSQQNQQDQGQEQSQQNQNQQGQGQQNQQQNQQGQGQNQQSQQGQQPQQQNQQGQGQNQQSQQGQEQPEWQITDKDGDNEKSQEYQNTSPNQQQWLDQIERNPYGLLKGKLKLIYEKEYKNK